MGTDIHVYLAKHNSENEWERIILYTKDNKEVSVYSNRNYELFDLLKESVWTYGIPIRRKFLSEEMKEIYDKDKQNGCFDFMESTFADIKNYLNMFPTVKDYNEDEDKYIDKSNPVQDFLIIYVCIFILRNLYGWVLILK